MEFLMNILAIGAHFDDVELGCGGTILKHIQGGDNVYIAVTSADEFRTGLPQVRVMEQEQSLNKMGLTKKSLHVFSYKDEIHDIIGKLDEIQPGVVITQYEKDTHQDHIRAFKIGQAVGRKKGITTLFYDSGSSYDFHPTVFSMIVFSQKMDLLKCYMSQIEVQAINLDIIQSKDRYWATLISDAPGMYAEGFIGRKMIYEI